MTELTVGAMIENLPKVTEFVEQQMEVLDIPIKTQMKINMAVDEIFNNIASYAYGAEGGQATVQIKQLHELEAVALTFIDHGIPYDPLAKEDPDTTLSAEEREIGSLGIFMVKKTMDEMIYERKRWAECSADTKRLLIFCGSMQASMALLWGNNRYAEKIA